MAIFTEQVEAATWLVQFISDRVATPLIILFLGIALGKLIGNVLKRFFVSIELDKHLRRVFTYRADYSELIAGGIAAVLYTVSVVWAFTVAGIIGQAVLLVVFVLVVFGALSAALAARDFLPDVYAGIAVREKVKKGEILECAGVQGKVERVGTLDVRIRTEEELLISLPNRTVKKTL